MFDFLENIKSPLKGDFIFYIILCQLKSTVFGKETRFILRNRPSKVHIDLI